MQGGALGWRSVRTRALRAASSRYHYTQGGKEKLTSSFGRLFRVIERAYWTKVVARATTRHGRRVADMYTVNPPESASKSLGRLGYPPVPGSSPSQKKQTSSLVWSSLADIASMVQARCLGTINEGVQVSCSNAVGQILRSRATETAPMPSLSDIEVGRCHALGGP